ncbi:MAG: hypothetical protein WCI63_03365 [bacterium]
MSNCPIFLKLLIPWDVENTLEMKVLFLQPSLVTVFAEIKCLFLFLVLELSPQPRSTKYLGLRIPTMAKRPGPLDLDLFLARTTHIFLRSLVTFQNLSTMLEFPYLVRHLPTSCEYIVASKNHLALKWFFGEIIAN